MNDIIAEFEQEKFEMQKQHTKNIQDILDDTNTRLQKMEKEYGQQTASTVGQRSLLYIADWLLWLCGYFVVGIKSSALC